MNPKKKCELF
ncbi:Protein CBG25694 [Caenorhabditis briggsae]|uniref:Protein CBG25694 n=1 Tax=Caenorhabditis briggsae TaxID=6238 RepID=B6IKQ0_CAEBR|nr:Protein CBG25694 [Caenorhabditis briggsae]CAS00480.1 Protein CBG25694 [Caenorhabditis briggsae]